MNIEKVGKEIIDQIVTEWNTEKARHLHFDDGFSFIAKENDAIIGFISGYFSNNNEFFIDIIDVKPEFRRQGIGSALISESFKEAKSRGVTKARSWSSFDKEDAIKMWKTLGFEMTRATQISEKTHQPVEGYKVVKDL